MSFSVHSKLSAYLSIGHELVEGWLNPIDALIIRTLSDIQKRAGTKGATGEIGVHHGRLAILLFLLLNQNERGFCIDVFSMQEQNFDQSGSGDEFRFRDNLSRIGLDPSNIQFFRKSSHLVTAEEIHREVGPVRIFSVDGSHTAEMTQNDLTLAGEAICDDGVVILDDCFNKDWPGVVEGTCRYFAEPNSTLMPFAISFNKTFLCKAPHQRRYLELVKQHHEQHLVKEYEFFGHPIAIFGDLAARPLLLVDWKKLADRGLGPATSRRLRWYVNRMWWRYFAFRTHR